MKKPLFFAFLFVAGALSLASCKSPPTEEMDRAFDAVMRANNNADALNYAGNTILRARETLSNMVDEAELKRYDQVRNLAAEAIALAERALVEGRAGAGRARDEATGLLDVVGTELTQTQGEIDAARNADLDLDVNSLEQGLAAARNGYDDARISLDEENYLDAISNAEPVRPALAEIRTTINDAAMDASRKK